MVSMKSPCGAALIAGQTALLLLLLVAAACSASSPAPVLISHGMDSVHALTGAASELPSVSADGRYVAFVSNAINFADVRNGVRNVFLRDLQTGGVELVSRSAAGQPGDADSFTAVVSGDGRFVAFGSYSANLVPGDTNGISDIFVRDRTLGTVERVSVTSGGAQRGGIGDCYGCTELAMSPDGRFVVFHSTSDDLVHNDQNYEVDVFIRDRTLSTTERVSVAAGNAQPNGSSGAYSVSVSADGRYIAFPSWATNLVPGDTNGAADMFVRDRTLGFTERVSVSTDGAQADDYTASGSISADGRYVAFACAAGNLEFPILNYSDGIYVRDRTLGTTERVDLAQDGNPAEQQSHRPAISPDGRYVAFTSYAGNLVPDDTNQRGDAFIRDRLLAVTDRVSVTTGGTEGDDDTSSGAVLSADGRRVAFMSTAALASGDTNSRDDVFARDRLAGITIRVSESGAGSEGRAGAQSITPDCSTDGRYVVFLSDADNLVQDDHNGIEDVFVRDTLLGTIERANLATTGEEEARLPWGGQGHSAPSISADGRYVVFASAATNLVPNDTNFSGDVFVRDRLLDNTQRLSVDALGAEVYGGGFLPTISADGRWVAFASYAALVAEDTNQGPDVYVRDLQLGAVTRASVASDGTQSNSPFDWVEAPAISADGRYIAFISMSDQLVAGDTNDTIDVFVRDRVAGTTERVSVDSFGTEIASGWGAYRTSMSANGRYVAFETGSPDLAPDDFNYSIDLFVHDRVTGATERASLSSEGTEGFDGIGSGALDPTGRYVAFYSSSEDLVPGDSNNSPDIFLRDLLNGETVRVNLAGGGEQTHDVVEYYYGSPPALSWGARKITFSLDAVDLVPEGSNGTPDVYQIDRGTGPPPAPTGVTASLVDRTVQLAWVDGGDDEQGFLIERKASAGAYVEIAQTSENATAFLDSSPPSNQQVQYRIAAFNAAGVSRYSDVVGVDIPPYLPAPPTSPSAVAVSESEIRISWSDASPNETGFEVERWQGKEYVLRATLDEGAASFVDAGLMPGTEYIYRVRAVNQDGPSAYADEVSATTLVAPAGRLKVAVKVNFGKVQVGRTATRPLSLDNTSRDRTLRVTVGATPAPFERTPGVSSLLLSPRGHAVISLVFRPEQAGKFTRTLTFTSSDPNRPTVSVTLMGIGITRR